MKLVGTIPQLASLYVSIHGERAGSLLLNIARFSHVLQGYAQTFVIGPQGSGKTRYIMIVMYKLYDDWDKVLHTRISTLPPSSKITRTP